MLCKVRIVTTNCLGVLLGLIFFKAKDHGVARTTRPEDILEKKQM